MLVAPCAAIRDVSDVPVVVAVPLTILPRYGWVITD